MANTNEINLYQNCVLGFVDILGFADFIDNLNPENLPKLRNVIDIATFINPTMNSKAPQFIPSQSDNLPIGKIFFSDSMIFYASGDSETSNQEPACNKIASALLLVTYCCNEYLKKLALNGFIARGAISSGQFYHDGSNLFFGSALNNAVRLEKEAKLPRVILDRKLLYSSHFGMKPMGIVEDYDGVYYADYLSFPSNYFEEIAFLKAFRLKIIENIEVHSSDNNLLPKWLYTAKKFNQKISDADKHLQMLHNSEPIELKKQIPYYEGLASVGLIDYESIIKKG